MHLSLASQERLYTGLAQALHAGLPPLTYVAAAKGTLPDRLIGALHMGAQHGIPLSTTLGKLGILAGADLAFLQAGEAQGRMPASLRLLARRAADRRRDRGKVVLALAYPLLLALLAVLVLPLPLVFRDGFAAYLGRVVPPLLAFGVVGLLALVVLPRMDRDAGPRRFLRKLGAVLPATGHALRDGSIATFLDVLGTCIAVGLPVRQALPLALDAAPHDAFRTSAPLARLDDGATLAEAVATIPIVPPATVAQIAQAEIAGKFDETLGVLASDHGRRARMATVVAVVALGVIAAASVVGVLAWSVIEAWLLYFRAIEKAAGP